MTAIPSPVPPRASHPGRAALAAWTNGTAPAMVALSVEQHLMVCASCRDAIAEIVREDPRPTVPSVATTWSVIRDRTVFPPDTLVRRVLRALGLSDGDATLVLQTPTARQSWWWSIAVVVAFLALASTRDAREPMTSLFLLVAPVVPMLGVALAYGPAAGPSLEPLVATPYSAVRLLVLRMLAVVVACVPFAVVGTVVLPTHVAHWWLLPAVALGAAVLALSSWVPPWPAVATLTLGWMAAVAAATRLATPEALLGVALLWTYAAVVACAPVVLVLRARHLGTLGRIS